MIIIREGQKLLALSSEIIIYKEKLKTYVGVSVFLWALYVVIWFKEGGK